MIGATLAREMGISVGDIVELELPPPIDFETFRPRYDAPSRHELRIVGTVTTGTEYELRVLLTTLEAVQAMTDASGRAMGVEVHLSDDNAAARVARTLEERIGPRYTVLDWCQLNEEALRCKLEP